MPNSLYSQLNQGGTNNPMIERIKQFKSMFSGDPKEMVQGLINSGRISQAQVEQLAKQADQIYKLMR